MPVTTITPANSKEFLETYKDGFVVLVFNAEFTQQEDIVNEATKALEKIESIKCKVALGYVDVEKNNDLATQFSILSIPALGCIFNGRLVRKVDDLEPTKVVSIISEELKKHEIISGLGLESSSDPKEKLNEYLKKLINRAPVMIFMKGDPEAPRCGFSRQLVELLGKHQIKYETFDILQDDDVRQGLKELSDWPTYPQIYVKGEIIGGLDVLKQLDETGELESTLKV